jgi:hypothetical protein
MSGKVRCARGRPPILPRQADAGAVVRVIAVARRRGRPARQCRTRCPRPRAWVVSRAFRCSRPATRGASEPRPAADHGRATGRLIPYPSPRVDTACPSRPARCRSRRTDHPAGRLTFSGRRGAGRSSVRPPSSKDIHELGRVDVGTAHGDLAEEVAHRTHDGTGSERREQRLAAHAISLGRRGGRA